MSGGDENVQNKYNASQYQTASSEGLSSEAVRWGAPGYATSMRQYRSYLRSNLNAEKLQHYTIDSKERSQTLVYDEDLLSAVRSLPPRGVKAISAIVGETNPSIPIALVQNRTVPMVLPNVVRTKTELEELLDCFCRYTDVECYHCPKNTRSGARYRFHVNEGFSHCLRCHDNLDQDQRLQQILSDPEWESDVLEPVLGPDEPNPVTE